METIAVFNTRGGSGKSAATVFMADFMAAVFMQRVLVVDLDPQQSSSVALLGEDLLHQSFGEKKCLAGLLRRAFGEQIQPNVVRYGAIERPANPNPRKGTVYLAPLNVMACDREAWHDLNDDLCRKAKNLQRRHYNTLARLLHNIKSDYDICLIDFPGHECGPITANGLRASGWWLFPCVPDRPGTRDIEGPAAAIEEAYRTSKGRCAPKPLGTLLSISQSANSAQYKQSVHTLRKAAEEKIIPRLFSDKVKMLNWTGARTALDDTRWNQNTSLKQKYKEQPLFNAARALCKESLDRMQLSVEEVKINTGLLAGLNQKLRTIFVGSRT